ncbi:Glucan 1,3-beta-glucosidase [Lachnellula arida]|uniref:Glucan 1,3-beta-glucosidase n=1 Tax=Lachnellula arida TaxID=1316785 RepID=A0A8T9BCP8_9HELO|nr:Glucan 1,3-beta-glucosidase [Lachnellula arida]
MKLFDLIAIAAALSVTTAKVHHHHLARADDLGLNSNTTRPAVFWREAMTHNGRPGYLNSDDAALYSVWRDVRNTTFAGGVVGDGISDDSGAIQAAINYGTGEVLYSRNGTAAQTTVPAIVYIPGGNYLINSSLQLPVQTMLIGDPLNPPVLIADPSLGTDPIVYVYDSDFEYITTTQFFQGLRNLVFDTTRAPANQSANGINLPGSQANSVINCHFIMTVGSQHLGIQMYGPDGAGGSGTILGDLTFYGGGLINVTHVFTATFQGLQFKNCSLAIDSSSSTGSLSLLDSSCSHTTNVVNTRTSSTGDYALVIENFKSDNCGSTVVDASDGSALLPGSVAGTWVMGPVFDSKSGTNSSSNGTTTSSSVGPFANSTSGASNNNGTGTNNTSRGVYIRNTRPTLLTNDEGDYFTMQMPQYENYDVSQVSNVKSEFGAVGDGKTDDTIAIQAALIANACNKITFIPQGTYLIYQTIVVPPGSRVVGEVWSVLNAAGPIFSDASNPQVMLRVGSSGDVGVAQFSDLLFSVSGVLPGAILVEVNMAGTKKGDVGFWNTHFRVGGWVGSGDMRRRCQTDDTSNCKAAFLMMHLTETSSAYLENVWGWTADHDLDGGPSVSAAPGRGLLVSAKKGTWLTGTSFEHNALYQYQLVDAENVYIGMQQTETPYWQGPGSPNLAPDPWTPDATYNDPTFSNCGTNAQCNMAWTMRVVGGKNIFAYNSAFWVFFNHWAPGNYGGSVDQTLTGQFACATVEADPQDLFWFNIDTRVCDYIVFDNNRTQTRQVNAPGSWGGQAAAYLS